MGFLKDVRKLQKQAKELDKTWDPGASMAQTMQAMQSAGAVMERQTVAARLAVEGEPATAQVNVARDTGQLLNQQPIVEISLLIFPEGQPPYPLTVQEIVPMTQLGRLTPGSRLAVKVDPKARDTIWIDWMAS
ncbi:MAG: hypothetical protein H6Q11_201 [Acidobacteria bacterium]|jgi:hypothetical protein|nr:hypothetical protein [Acidobacteriota bacterium]